MIRSLLALAVLGFSVASYAQPTTLMVSIDRIVPADQVQKAVSDLNFDYVDPSTGTIDCSAHARVRTYIPYDSTAPYYGVALVEVNSQCMDKVVGRIEADGRYTVYSNSRIELAPVVSGRN